MTTRTEEPWRNYRWKDGKRFMVPMETLLERLSQKDIEIVNGVINGNYSDSSFLVWQKTKVENILQSLNEGTPVESLPPVELAYDKSSNRFGVSDGRSRIIAYKIKGVEVLPVKLYRG